MIAFIAWASVFAVPPLIVLTLVLEGPHAALHALANARADAWGAVAWQVLGNTLFGWAAWSFLLSRYEAAVVTPYALLIPVFGMGSSALVLGESLPAWKLAGGALVLGGIAVIVFTGTVRARLRPMDRRRAPAPGD
jgi:O-acetylserine/cysteine efflux transporter